MTGGCGLPPLTLFDEYDRRGSFLRTFLGSLASSLTALTGLAANWRMQGISSLRSFWALTTLGRLTDESESGSSDAWPTARASAAHGPSQAEIEAGDPRHRLETAVMCQWPTHTRAEGGKIACRPNYGQVGLSNHHAIVGPVAREKGQKSRAKAETAPVNMVNWATPRGEDSQCAGAHHGKPDSLHAQTKATWATPASADCIGATGGGQGRSLRTDTAQSPGQLHPDWVETLQGYPVGWTDVGPPDRAKRSTTGSRRAQDTASPTEPPA